MTRAVRFEPEAADELDHAAQWYQRQKPGLGFEFLDAVDRSIALLRQWPHAASLAKDVATDLAVRRAPVDRFPYSLFYLETPAAIRVLAVAHDSRRPNYWMKRTRE